MLTWLRRNWQFAALTGWTALWFALLAPGTGNRPAGGGIAWRPFLVQGSKGLFTGMFRCFADKQSWPGGLHLYANCPSLQIGPASFVVAEPVRYLGPHSGLVAAEVLISAMGLATLLVIRKIVVTARPELAGRPGADWAFLAGGAIFIVGWQELAVAFAHLDDGLVLLGTVLATWAAVRGKAALTGLALGLAIVAKPWALAFLPVLLLAGGLTAWRAPNLAARPLRANVRPCMLAGAVAALVTLAGWLPFFLADSRTSLAFHYKITNVGDTALRVLGVASAQTPSWDRPAQVAIGCVLAGVAVWRGRWPAVILLAVGARIALDPATHSYYTAGVLAGALLWDLLGSRRPFPAWTLASYAALDLVPLITHDQTARGALRLGLVVAFTGFILLGPPRWYWRPVTE